VMFNSGVDHGGEVGHHASPHLPLLLMLPDPVRIVPGSQRPAIVFAYSFFSISLLIRRIHRRISSSQDYLTDIASDCWSTILSTMQFLLLQ
jgi:hypothetical protein